MAYEFVEEEPSFSEKAKSSIEGAQRNIARNISNLATRAVGLPGDVFSLINEYIGKPASKALGFEEVPYEQTLVGKFLPTTETHRKGLSKATGGYLSPQSDVEKFADDIIEDAALLFTPMGRVGRFTKGTRTPMARLQSSFLKSVGANLVGKTAEQLADREDVGAWAKMGTLFLSSIFDTPSAIKQVGNLYKQAEKKLPPGASLSSKKLDSQVFNLKSSLTKGRPIKNLSPSEKFVIDEADKITNMTKNGTLSIEQAIAQKRSLNENLQKHVYDSLDKKAAARARSKASLLNHYLKDSIQEYGKTNPSFYKDFKNADEAFSALSKSNFISNWAKNNLSVPIITHGLMDLFGATLGKAAIPYQGVKLMYQIKKSPHLRKLYIDSLKSASKEDSVSFNKYLSKLDEELTHEKSKEKYEFVD